MKALINACIYDFHGFREDSYILFDSEIKDVGPMKSFPGAEEVYDCEGSIVMPGLTNCHTHIYSAFSRGINLPFDPKSFRDILEQLWWRVDAGLDGDSTALSAMVYGIDCIKSGVTSIIDHHASGMTISGSLEHLKTSICDELGLRGVFCFETSDRFNVQECIEENIRFGSRRSQMHRGLFGMHASMTLSDETLEAISRSIGDMPIHIHVAESREDADGCMNAYGISIVERLDKFGLLKKDSILSHCVHISSSDARLIAQRGCYAALNPSSNMNNAVGLADYEMLRRSGVKCIIGNDGLGANITRDYQNMVFSMHHRLQSPTMFSIDDLRGLIENGYELLGRLLGIRIGRIEKGYKADMAVIPYAPTTPMDDGNALGHMFFGVFDNFHPQYVWVDGKCLLKDYNLTRGLGDIYEQSRREAGKVWERIKKQ